MLFPRPIFSRTGPRKPGRRTRSLRANTVGVSELAAMGLSEKAGEGRKFDNACGYLGLETSCPEAGGEVVRRVLRVDLNGAVHTS